MNALRKEKYEIDHIWKTKNRTKKKSFVRKIAVRWIRIFPVNLATFEENLIFWTSFWTFRTQITQNLKNLRHDFSLVSALCIFYVKMATSERGGACISFVGKQPNFHSQMLAAAIVFRSESGAPITTHILLNSDHRP